MYGKGCVTLWADSGNRGKKKKRGSKQCHHNSSAERVSMKPHEYNYVLAVALAVRWTEALTVNGCDVCGSSISVGLL